MTDPIAEDLVQTFAVHFRRLRRAIEGLDLESLDRILAPDTNSIAVLVTHVCGSQLDWLHIATDRAMARNRDEEFRTRGRDAAALLELLDRAEPLTNELLRTAVDEGLGTRRRSRQGREGTAAWCVLHALDHTAEHVGQIELTRQLVTR